MPTVLSAHLSPRCLLLLPAPLCRDPLAQRLEVVVDVEEAVARAVVAAEVLLRLLVRGWQVRDAVPRKRAAHPHNEVQTL